MPRLHPNDVRDAPDAAASASTAPREAASGIDADDSPELLSLPPMRYQSEYVWLIFFASLDIMLTWAILRRGGEEVNPMARMVIDWWGLNGAIAFKFGLMLFVIVSCEVCGRRRNRAGVMLARTAVGISAAPVVYSLGLLVNHFLLHPAAP